MTTSTKRRANTAQNLSKAIFGNTMNSDVENNKEHVRVGMVLVYSDICNYWKWEVTELFDGGFEAKSLDPECPETDDKYFERLQIGWTFSTEAIRQLEAEGIVLTLRQN